MGLNGLGVGQNCPPFPSETRPGRSVVSRGAYFLAGGFLAVEAGLLDSAAGPRAWLGRAAITSD